MSRIGFHPLSYRRQNYWLVHVSGRVWKHGPTRRIGQSLSSGSVSNGVLQLLNFDLDVTQQLLAYALGGRSADLLARLD